MLVEKQIIIARPAPEVLEAFTETKHTAQWWFGCTTHAVLKEGGMVAWQWRNEQGPFLYLSHCRVAGYQPGLYLQLDACWQFDHTKSEPIGPVNLLLECTPQAGHTLLVVKHGPFETSTPEWQEYAAAVDTGWDTVLTQLKSYLEQRTTAG